MTCSINAFKTPILTKSVIKKNIGLQLKSIKKKQEPYKLIFTELAH